MKPQTRKSAGFTLILIQPMSVATAIYKAQSILDFVLQSEFYNPKEPIWDFYMLLSEFHLYPPHFISFYHRTVSGVFSVIVFDYVLFD